MNQLYKVHSPTIKPLDVIKAWSLCPHLSSIVRLMNLMTYKTLSLIDLKKIERNLMKELQLFQDRILMCCSALPNTRTLTPETISSDWQLSFHLREVLSNIRAYQQIHHSNGDFYFLKEEILQQAIAHISTEIHELLSKQTTV